MRIAFLASRKGYLKVMGSLIQAAIERGHEALLLTDPGERKPGEATTPEDLAHWPRARVLPIQRGASLVPLLTGARAEALVGRRCTSCSRAWGRRRISGPCGPRGSGCTPSTTSWKR